jgi:hypothetical protein
MDLALRDRLIREHTCIACTVTPVKGGGPYCPGCAQRLSQIDRKQAWDTYRESRLWMGSGYRVQPLETT